MESYKEPAFFTSAGMKIRNSPEMLQLLEAIFLPDKMAITYCPGHQKSNDPISRGNAFADQAAKQVATSKIKIGTTLTLVPVLMPELSMNSDSNLHPASQLKATETEGK